MRAAPTSAILGTLLRALWASALASICLGQLARADTIFIDINISSEELKAARQAAQARGERLVVIPEVPEKARREFQDLTVTYDRLSSRAAPLYKKVLQFPDGPEKKAINRQLSELEPLVDKASERRKQYAAPYMVDLQAKLRQAIQQIEASGRTVNSMIISGHSRGRNYSGFLGSISTSQIQATFSAFPRSLAALKSVYLWGCHTAERDHVLWWKTSFPNLKVILGFSGQGPSGRTLASPGLLKDALEREAQMASQNDLKAAARLFRSLNHVGSTEAIGAINSCYVGVRTPAMRIDDASSACRGAQEVLKVGAEEFFNYLRAEKGFPDPPADTHHSSLRTFYANYQKFGGCEDAIRKLYLPPRENVLALIFFKNVRKNFARYFLIHSLELNKRLAEAGMTGFDVPPLNSSSTTRAEILGWMDRMEKLKYRQLAPTVTQSPAYETLMANAARILRDLSCVPFSWITEEPIPSVTPEAPRCQ